MKVLGIDTTRKSAVVYVYNSDDNLRYSLKMSDSIKHSEGLFLYIEKALFECKMKLSDFDVFSGVVGPGSFTGIRVGMSVLKGFNEVFHKKLLPITTFEILSKKYKKGIILLNSTTTSCYYAKLNGHKVIEDGCIAKVDIEKIADGEKVIYLKEEQEYMQFEYNNIEVVENIDDLFFDCLIDKLSNSEDEDFLPYYLQVSQAERGISGGQN